MVSSRAVQRGNRGQACRAVNILERARHTGSDGGQRRRYGEQLQTQSRLLWGGGVLRRRARRQYWELPRLHHAGSCVKSQDAVGVMPSEGRKGRGCAAAGQLDYIVDMSAMETPARQRPELVRAV